MARIEYFNNELSKNKGYEYDMALLAMMTDTEKTICFGMDNIEDIPQMIAEYYIMMN